MDIQERKRKLYDLLDQADWLGFNSYAQAMHYLDQKGWNVIELDKHPELLDHLDSWGVE